MVLLEINELEKSYNSEPLFTDVTFKVYEGDRIGLVGSNGSGKSTLLKILCADDEDYKGHVIRHGHISYMPQMAFEYCGHRSGGGYTKDKIYGTLRENSALVLLDEPTCNMDMNSIQHLERQLMNVPAFLVVSHDEALLEKVCNKILHIKNGHIRLHPMDYKAFKDHIDQASSSQSQAYESYVKEKHKLNKSISINNANARKIKKAPSRMGNSEARLHKREAGERRAKVEARSKNMDSRLAQLPKVDKPFVPKTVHIKLLPSMKLHSPIVAEGRNINKAFGKKVLFHDAAFTIYNNEITLLQGNNGSGKSTLVSMMLAREEAFTFAKNTRIAYFDQKFSDLMASDDLIEAIQRTSSRETQEIRDLLGQFLFRRQEVYKKVGQLSGGELVRLCLAKIILSDNNFLILDEPTNYLDIETIGILKKALQNYEGAVLLISHDRRFASGLAHRIYKIENLRIQWLPPSP